MPLRPNGLLERTLWGGHRVVHHSGHILSGTVRPGWMPVDRLDCDLETSSAVLQTTSAWLVGCVGFPSETACCVPTSSARIIKDDAL